MNIYFYTKVTLLTALILFSFLLNAYADDQTAATCELTDVQAAKDLVEASGGGTVYIPAGACNWNIGTGGQYAINILRDTVSFVGAGTDKTILRVTDGSGFFKYGKGEGFRDELHPFLEISGFTFYSNLGCTELRSCPESPGISVVFTEDFRVHDNHFEGYFSNTVHWKKTIKGLIDNNVMINHNIAAERGRYGIMGGMQYGGIPPNTNLGPDRMPMCTGDEVNGVTRGCSCQVGRNAKIRNSYIEKGHTVISSEPAQIDQEAVSGTGVVQRIYVNIDSIDQGATIKIASFSKSGDTFTVRAGTTGLEVKPGLNIFSVDDGEFSPFVIHDGDYIGVYLNGATLENTDPHSSWIPPDGTHWAINGDQTGGTADFGSENKGGVSIWAEIYDDDDVMKNCEDGWITWYHEGTFDSTVIRDKGYPIFDRNWKYDANAIYVEDNTITYIGNVITLNWGANSKIVNRHNTIYTLRTQTTFAKPGSNYLIVHDNYFEHIGSMDSSDPSRRMGVPGGNVVWLETDALVYDNTFVNYSTAGTYEAQRSYGTTYYFPFYVRPKEIYIWNNDYDGVSCGSSDTGGVCWDSSTSSSYHWMNLPGDNGVVHFRAPEIGERLYSFEEYPYPHPGQCPDDEKCTTLGGTEICDNVDTVCAGATVTGACDIGNGTCCAVACVPETTPPEISGGLPDHNLMSGTTSTTISVTTDEDATCRYSQSAGVGYSSMTNTFDTTGSLNHSEPITGLSDGDNLTYHIRCQDIKGNFNTDDYLISFGVDYPDLTPPVISNVQVSHDESGSIISFSTNELTNGNVEYGLDTTYGASVDFKNYTINHQVGMSSLIPETLYYYRINAIDQSSNAAGYTGQFTTPPYTGWLTPVTVVSSCGGEGNYLIDGDVSTNWHHWSTEQHDIVLDLGDVYTVTKIRHYHKQWEATNGIAEVYLSETNGNWGGSLGSLPGYHNEPTGYKELDLADTTARYVRLVSDSCSSPYWKEFSVYVEPIDLKGDINNDCTVNLEDTITALMVAAGATHLSVNVDADVDGDGVIGLKDAIATLQITVTQQ